MLSLPSRCTLVICFATAATAACSSSESDSNPTPGEGGAAAATSMAGSGGVAGTTQHGGSGGAEEPPFEVGPKQYGIYLAFDTQNTLACTAAMQFVYYEPVGTGPFPIFVFAKGTRGEWDNDSLIHDEMLRRMAVRGFVAASPDYQSNPDIYPSQHGFSCPGFRDKARCMFAPPAQHAESLVAVLDDQTRADSSLGIATSGISQGGFVALVAGDYNANVRATNPYSVGTFCGTDLDFSACAAATSCDIEPERVRIVNGENDQTFGGQTTTCDGQQQLQPIWYREQLNAMSGQSCDTSATTYECLRSNGSGWILARNDQVAGGNAHHAFIYSAYPTTPDPNWAATSEAWGREASQTWLANRIAAP